MAEMAVQGLLEFWPCKSVNNPNFGLPIAFTLVSFSLYQSIIFENRFLSNAILKMVHILYFIPLILILSSNIIADLLCGLETLLLIRISSRFWISSDKSVLSELTPQCNEAEFKSEFIIFEIENSKL